MRPAGDAADQNRNYVAGIKGVEGASAEWSKAPELGKLEHRD